MKLNPECVEKAAAVLDAAPGIYTPYSQSIARDIITAYFDHLRESGKAREAAGGDVYGSYWFADTETGMWENPEFKAIIIKQEE